VVVVRGWALFGPELPARIDIAVDGIPVGLARAQIPRLDVADAISTLSALASGFEHHVVVPLSPGESRTLTLTATASHDSGRTWSSSSRRVHVTAREYEPESLQRSQVLRAKTIADLGTAPDRDPATMLVFTHSLAVGGGQLFLSEILRRLHQHQGIHCTVVSPTDGVLRNVLQGWGIPVHVVDGFPVESVDAYERGVRELANLARDVGSRVALVNTLGVFPGVDAAQLAGMEVIWAIHESFELPVFSFLNWGAAGLDPVIHDRWTASMRNVSAAVFECEATSRLFAPYIPDERRLIIPYGISVHEIEVARQDLDRRHIRESYGISPDALVLLAMSVWEPRKGQASLVEAFARVAPTHSEAVLVLVGEHPSGYAKDVERLIALHGLQERIIRVPIALDVYDWYVASDALVSASDVESVPRSMLEAMAFGLPVMAADAHGIPELIRNGSNGWLFPTRDFSGLTAALERLVTSLAGERKRIAQTANDGIAFFDADLYTADFDTLIRSLAQGPRESVRELVPQRGWRPSLPLGQDDHD
jgi:glycosyltransferase involved in cell wall biosynthesis